MKRFWKLVPIYIILIGILGIACWKIYGYYRENKESMAIQEGYYKSAVRVVDAGTEENDSNHESQSEKESQPESTCQPEQERVNLPLDVDFEILCAENPDVVGWLYCPETQINYPVLQGEDNQAYLYHLPNGEYNKSGSLFLDAGNASDFSNIKSIIYGHNMKIGTMFGSLKLYKEQAYYDQHPEMYLFTPDAAYLIQLFAGVITDNSSRVYDLEDSDLDLLINEALKKSTFKTDIVPTEKDRLLLLSTCSYEVDNGRYVLFGIMKVVA